VRQGLPDIEISCAFAAGLNESLKKRYCRCMWECDRGATFRYGVGEFEPLEMWNQCLFVRGYAISGREPFDRYGALPEGPLFLSR
jgi:hypothetical protein